MPYLGNTPADRFTTTTVDTFNGDNSTTEFTLSRSAVTNDLEVIVENVQQEPTTAYSVSGTTLTFTAAPPTGTGNIYVIHRGAAISSVTPANGTVSVDMLSATGTKSGSTFLAGDNSFKTVAVTPTAVSDQANSSTGFFALPSGTTAERPASPANGYIRYNTDDNVVEEYRNGSWEILSNIFFASGGTEVTSGGYKYHTFTSSDTFTVSSGTASIDYLIIAGGGAGKDHNSTTSTGGGAGGAGGVLSGTTTVNAGSFSIVVGAGGNASNGENSTAFNLTAIGGGQGGARSDLAPTSGGSGGGGAYDDTTGASGTSGQGNNGGNLVGFGGGGGGGAGGAGGNGTGSNATSVGGVGGLGVDYSAWATATSTGDNGYYASGGSGASGDATSTRGAVSDGGGGRGGAGGAGVTGYAAENGQANTGGGGGGAGPTTAGDEGGHGGSGIVIIRYAI